MQPPTNQHGHPPTRTDWTPEVAMRIAQDHGLTLTDEHWRIIHLVRAYHADHDLSPAMRPLVKLVREALGEDKGASLHLLMLFPGNPAKLAAKIAGLPSPTPCL